jgi:hypothetical protein
MATTMGHAGVLSSNQLAGLMFRSFLLSLVIAIIAVAAFIGGGVIFTPLLLAFTAIDTLVARSSVVLWVAHLLTQVKASLGGPAVGQRSPASLP